MPMIFVQLNTHEPFKARVKLGEEPLDAAKRAMRRRYGWDGIELGSTRYGTNQSGGETWPIISIKRRGTWDSTGTDPDTLAWWIITKEQR